MLACEPAPEGELEIGDVSPVVGGAAATGVVGSGSAVGGATGSWCTVLGLVIG
jgi:hypothetical protein